MAHDPPQSSAEVSPETVRAGHEPSVVNLRVLTITGLSIAGAVLVIHLMLIVLHNAFAAQQARTDERGRLSAIAERPDLPPRDVPRLQGIPGFNDKTPRSDMRDFARAVRTRLDTYGPTTQPGVVRLPVDRAMDLALERGLFPARAAAPVEPKSPTPGGAHDSE